MVSGSIQKQSIYWAFLKQKQHLTTCLCSLLLFLYTFLYKPEFLSCVHISLGIVKTNSILVCPPITFDGCKASAHLSKTRSFYSHFK